MKMLFSILLLVLSFNTFSSENCVTNVYNWLGLSLDARTEPKLLNEILENEMFLGDFKSFKAVLGDKLTARSSLAPMFRTIKNAVEQKHPAIYEFLCTIEQKNMLTDVSAYRAHFNRMAHHMFILDALVEKMVESPSFMQEVYQYILSKREELGVRSSTLGSAIDVFRATGAFFQTAKMVTMDHTIEQYLHWREKDQLDETDLDAKNKGLFLNIMEATSLDFSKKNFSNAKTGAALALLPVADLQVVGPHRVIKQVFAKGWSELYQTWNLAFMAANLEDLQILYPKLLIPQVINANADDYLFRRGITLWVTANILLFNKLNPKPRPYNLSLPHQAARLWGDINFKYAQQVLKDSGSKDKVDAFTIFRLIKRFLSSL